MQTNTHKKQQKIYKTNPNDLKPFNNGGRTLTCNAKFILTKKYKQHTTNREHNKQQQQQQLDKQQ